MSLIFWQNIFWELQMLTLVLFGVIFSSAAWLIYAFRLVGSALSGMALADAGILNVLLYVLFICLPVFLLWAVFGFISQYLYGRMTARQLFKLFSQMKKNQEYSDLLARIMLETEQNIKNSFILSRFDLLIADMNELLSEFLQRERLASAEQTEHLWTKVQNGGKWSFGKVLIENYNRQPAFQRKIFDDAGNDPLLAGTIMEFCARYQTLLSILEKHDKERILLGIIETGVFGKVFAILAPVADEIRRTRDVFNSADKKETPLFQSRENVNPTPEPAAESFPAEVNSRHAGLGEKVGQIFGRFKGGKKEMPQPAEPQKDAFSLALERSFGEMTPAKEEPIFDSPAPETVKTEEDFISAETEVEDISAKTLAAETQPAPAETAMADYPTTEENSFDLGTQKTLDSLKKEWREFDNSAVRHDKNEDLTYPFGGWTDAENYQK